MKRGHSADNMCGSYTLDVPWLCFMLRRENKFLFCFRKQVSGLGVPTPNCSQQAFTVEDLNTSEAGETSSPSFNNNQLMLSVFNSQEDVFTLALSLRGHSRQVGKGTVVGTVCLVTLNLQAGSSGR